MGAVAADLFIATTTTAATIANDIMDAEVGTKTRQIEILPTHFTTLWAIVL
jgi:hypothetical protein